MASIIFRKVLLPFSFLVKTIISRISNGATFAFAICLIVLTWPAGAVAQTSFGAVNVGSRTTATATITVVNSSTLANIAVVTQGNPNLDFTNGSGGTCALGISYSANATCTVNVVFAPKDGGPRYGAVVLTDPNGNVMGTGYLQGIGQGPQIDFPPGSESTLSFSGLSHPSAIAVDAAGNLYIAEAVTAYSSQNAVVKETWTGRSYTQTTVATGLAYPVGVAIDGTGNVYIADQDAFEVLQEVPTGSGYTENPLFTNLGTVEAVAVDGIGNVYIGGDAYGVLKETLSNGSYTQSTIARTVYPSGMAVDGAGNVYLTVTASGSVLEETPSSGSYTETTLASNLNGQGLAVDANGNLYVGATTFGVVKLTLSGGKYVRSTVGAGIGYAQGVAVDGSGNIYVTSNEGNSTWKLNFADPPSLAFASTSEGTTSADSPHAVTIGNFGNAKLNFSSVGYPTDFPENSSQTTDCTASTELEPNNACTVTVNFTPIEPIGSNASLSLAEDVVLSTNASNSPTSIAVSGTETAPLVAATPPTASPAAGTYTSVQTVTLTDAISGATIYYTTDGTAPTTSSTLYSAPITVSTTETIKAIAIAAGYLNSGVFWATYVINRPPQDFTVTVIPASVDIVSGQSGNVALSLSPENGFSSTVTFNCSGLPSGASCSFSPPSVKPAGAAVTTTVTISTATAGSAVKRRSGMLFPVTLAVALCCCGWRKRRAQLAFVLIVCGLTAGCGGSGRSTSGQPVTSTVTVTATAGSLQHSATFSLTVQ